MVNRLFKPTADILELTPTKLAQLLTFLGQGLSNLVSTIPSTGVNLPGGELITTGHTTQLPVPTPSEEGVSTNVYEQTIYNLGLEIINTKLNKLDKVPRNSLGSIIFDLDVIDKDVESKKYKYIIPAIKTIFIGDQFNKVIDTIFTEFVPPDLSDIFQEEPDRVFDSSDEEDVLNLKEVILDIKKQLTEIMDSKNLVTGVRFPNFLDLRYQIILRINTLLEALDSEHFANSVDLSIVNDKVVALEEKRKDLAARIQIFFTENMKVNDKNEPLWEPGIFFIDTSIDPVIEIDWRIADITDTLFNNNVIIDLISPEIGGDSDSTFIPDPEWAIMKGKLILAEPDLDINNLNSHRLGNTIIVDAAQPDTYINLWRSIKQVIDVSIRIKPVPVITNTRFNELIKTIDNIKNKIQNNQVQNIDFVNVKLAANKYLTALRSAK